MRKDIGVRYVPVARLKEQCTKDIIMSCAVKLLEEVGDARTLIVGLDNDDHPFVWETNGRLSDALDFTFEDE